MFNLLISSLSVHKINVLPLIPISIVDVINDKLRNHLWNDGAVLVALNIIQTSQDQGSLKLVDILSKELVDILSKELVDILSKDKALKVQWVKAYQDFNEIRSLANCFFLLTLANLCGIWT